MRHSTWLSMPFFRYSVQGSITSYLQIGSKDLGQFSHQEIEQMTNGSFRKIGSSTAPVSNLIRNGPFWMQVFVFFCIDPFNKCGGFCRQALQWLGSYLADRFQFGHVNDKSSHYCSQLRGPTGFCPWSFVVYPDNKHLPRCRK